MKKFFPRLSQKSTADRKKEPDQDDKFIPDELALKKMDKKEASPLNDPVWKSSLRVVAGSFLLALFRFLIGTSHPVASWILAIVALVVWVMAVRLLLMDAMLKKLWIGWIILSLVLPMALSQADSLWMAAAGGSFIFLLFRKYKPYRHLTSRRRAALFLLGFLVLLLLGIGGRKTTLSESDQPLLVTAQTSETDSPGTLNLGLFLGRYADASLELFWIFSLLHIFFRARLHFMKLRPKLAISAVLIALIPLVLVILMGLLILYGTLGATRAIQARSILYEWKRLAATDDNFITSQFTQSFTQAYTADHPLTEGKAPVWLQGFISSLLREDASYAREEGITTDYFWLDSGLWLIRVDQKGDKIMSIQGGKVDQPRLDRLAQIVRADVRFVLSSSLRLKVSGRPLQLVETGGNESVDKIQGKYTTSRHRSLYFGMTDIDVVSLVSQDFEKRTLLLLLEVAVVDILDELWSQKNPFSVIVMVTLLTLAGFMLIFEAFMFFFGVRITTGFTSAVRSLFRGTKRIAEGNLETTIEIPNEDELGMLAASFNAMTKAVKKGREEAVLRAHLESELATARKIQEKLLPDEMPLVAGFEIAGTSIPSKQVGGDYFDFLDLGKGRLGIAIADVSGKGIPAALLMANLQASLHAQSLEAENVAEVAGRINNMLVKSTDANMFVTFFYGLLDRNRSTFTSTNAGHNPPIHLRNKKNIDRLTEGGLVLGFLPDQQYGQQVTALKPGDILVLYTDGITEARTPEEEKTVEDRLFGEDRLIRVIEDNASLSAREIQAAILQAVSDHTKNTPQGDDITLVVIKRRER